VSEQLGEAVLKLSVDDTALNAGLARARQSYDATAQAGQRAFNGQNTSGAVNSIQALETKLQGLRQSFASVEIGSREFRKLQAEIQRTERELGQVDKTLGNTFRERAGGFGSNLLGALGLGVGVGAGAAVGGFIKGSIDQAVELETITRKLQNTLGQQGANGALNFTNQLSRDLGLNFKTLADSFAGFTAAASAANVPIETQKGLFAAVSKAGQALGLSNDAVQGSFLALQQVASKGTVQMEELRGQLGERLPIALTATAKGLGISQQELIKLVESGKLTAAQFFPALAKGLNDLTAGAGGLETSAQAFQKFRNAWEQLQASFGTNLLPGITGAVNELTKALEGLGVESEARGLRGAFGLSADQAIQTVGALRTLREQYNLTERQARNITSQALASAGARRGLFGELNLNNQQFAAFQQALIDKAKAFRETNRDIKGEAQAAEAAQKALLDQQEKTYQARQKELTVQLKQVQAGLQLRAAQEALGAARITPRLDEVGRAGLQARLAINEKIRAVQTDQLELQRELDKRPGIGDGKNGNQNAARIQELRQKIQLGQVGVEQARAQGAQAEAAALRTQQERFRTNRLDAVTAAERLRVTQQLTGLEQAAALRQTQVSETAKLQLQQQLTLSEKLRQQDAARAALATELAKPKGQQDRVVIDDLQDRIRRANQDVRQAYADAGLALVQNARSAADALKSAQQGLDSTLRGGFEFLTPQLQQEQLGKARAAVQPLVDRGVIRQGLDISSPDKLFRLAGFADSFNSAESALNKALAENTAAQELLAKKDWQVNVNVPGGSATGDVVGAINGGLR